MKNCIDFKEKSVRKLNVSSEEDLAKKYLRQISKFETLSFEEETLLAKQIKEGNRKAKQKLISANLKLAANIALKIRNKNMPLSDLLQEANIGLMIAVDKYNYKLGYKFSTYAAWWIKQSVLKAISEQAGCVKVPVYVQEIIGKYSKMKSSLENELQKTLSIEDMAERMNIAPDKLEEYVNAFQKSCSLDAPIENDNQKECCIMDLIADENATATINAEMQNLKEDLTNALNSLKDREKEVVILRFGLQDDAKKTLEDIGKLYGITKECVRQTELRAIKHLKTLCNAKDMHYYCCQ